MYVKSITFGLAAAYVAAFGILPALAGSINGTWLRPKTGAHIQSFACGGGVGLKIVKSKKKKDIGTVIMCGAKKVKPNQYKGNLKSTEDGNTYTGYVTFSGNTLKLSGCVLGGLICKNENWRRVK